MDRPNFTFRRAQAAYDLICLAQAADAAVLVDLGGPALGDVVHDRACLFGDSDLEVFERVFLAAVTPEAPQEACLAFAILLADALQGGLAEGSLGDCVTDLWPALGRAPRQLRSAILRGVETAENLYLLGNASFEQNTVTARERTSDDRQTILDPLIKMARSMDGPTRDYVAQADYGDRAKDHRAGLDAVLARADCRFKDSETWYPSETVELIAHVPGECGFIPCTALLLVNALHTGDDQGWFDFRWERQAEAYRDLPDQSRAPILAGIRHLYEADQWFLTHHTRTHDPVIHPERMIPLVDLASQSA